MYADQWIVQFWTDRRSPLLDRIYAYLCCAKREAKSTGRPIYHMLWDINNPDDCVTRDIPADELCQCCETKLAQMINNGMIYRDNLGYIQTDNDFHCYLPRSRGGYIA